MLKYGSNQLISVIILAFFLTSCATLPPESEKTEKPWSQRKETLVRINRFNLEGKLAIQSDRDAGSATVNWEQNNQSFKLTLYGPLGVMLVTVSGHPGQTLLETPEGQTFRASSPETLLREHWGWNLPVSYLKYWVRGVPVPSLSARTIFDSSNHLKILKQDGWQVTYLNYTTVSGVDLPTKLFVVHPGLRAKLIVYRWEI